MTVSTLLQHATLGKSDHSGTSAAANLGKIPLPASFQYARTIPLPVYTGASTAAFRPLAVDPNVPGRMWCKSYGFDQLVYTDDNGATIGSNRVANPSGSTGDATGYTIVQLLFAQGFAWLVTTDATHGMSVFRSPIPATNGTGWSWTKIFSIIGLVNGPGGAAGDGGSLATGRNSVLAVNADGAFLGEYSSGFISGGPSVYMASNALTATAANIVWERAIQWPLAKHVHAVKIINGKLWVSLGDGGYIDSVTPAGELTQIGMWICSATNRGTVIDPTRWAQRSIYGSSPLGNYRQLINFFQVTIDGGTFVVGESDNSNGEGPIAYMGGGTGSAPFLSLCRMPFPYVGTMRGLALDPATNNLYAYFTGEGGASAPQDSLFVFPPPYNTPYLLESLDLGTEALVGDGIVNNGYAWLGRSRITMGRFPWQ